MAPGLPLLLLDPHPRTAEMVYDDDTARQLAEVCEVRAYLDGPAPDAEVDGMIGDVAVIVGQTDMGADRLRRAGKLRAIVNVLANWRPNVDYREAHARGVHVLSAAPAMAPAVAEWTLAAMLDLMRGLTQADRGFRRGEEGYGLEGCRGSRTLRGATVGIVGFGNLGRELLRLLEPFSCEVLAHDPWLSDGFIGSFGARSATMEEVLSGPDCIAIMAGATTENRGCIGRELLGTVRRDACVVLSGRAAVVDFEALVELASEGRFRLAVDVYPEEPVAAGSPWRGNEAVLWSSHRAGADPSSYALMREMVVDDVRQVVAGHEPMRLQRADPARAAIMNSV